MKSEGNRILAIGLTLMMTAAFSTIGWASLDRQRPKLGPGGSVDVRAMATATGHADLECTGQDDESGKTFCYDEDTDACLDLALQDATVKCASKLKEMDTKKVEIRILELSAVKHYTPDGSEDYLDCTTLVACRKKTIIKPPIEGF